MFGLVGCGAMYPLSPPPTLYMVPPPRPPRPALSLDTQTVELSCCAPQTWYGISRVTATWYNCAVEYCCPVQLSPAFMETLAPPSLLSIILCAFAGSIHKS